MTPSISVVVPTHDRPESLRRAVGAILAQDELPLELIIVNDGDEEVPPEIAGDAQAAGVGVRLLRLDHASATASRNRGMAAAEGDIVLLVDDDIVLPPDYLGRLRRLYAADPGGVVAGIGGTYRAEELRTVGQRLWRALSVMCGSGRWLPRVSAARHVKLPAALRGQLRPPRWLVGGAISLRRAVAATERFDEAFTGYAFSEDREFSFRVGRAHALFVAPSLIVEHEQAATGRGDMRTRGRVYVANCLRTARSLDRGVGSWLLVAYDLIGTLCLYALWSVLPGKGGNGAFAAGMLTELLARARATLKGL